MTGAIQAEMEMMRIIIWDNQRDSGRIRTFSSPEAVLRAGMSSEIFLGTF